MNRKISVILLLTAFILTLGFLFGFKKIEQSFAFADDKEAVFESKSFYTVEPLSGTVIFSKNEKEHRPIASMCKIMTLLLTFENIESGNLSLDSDVIVSETASGMGGSQVFLDANTSYKAEELIKSVVVASANDSCVALAEHICGNESEFVDKMNEKAASLNMCDTVFANCTGLPKDGQYSCAKDVSIMFSALLNCKDYFKFSRIWTDEIHHEGGRITEIANTNKLVRFYEGCDSGKTGYTTEAGHCLAASAVRNGMRIITVAICSPNSKVRFKEVSDSFNYCFTNYTNKLVIDETKPLEISVLVSGGKKDSVSVVAEKPLYIFSKKNVSRAVEINFYPCEKVKAPVNVGDILGEIGVFEDGIKIASVNIVSAEEVLKATYFDYIKNVVDNWGLI